MLTVVDFEQIASAAAGWVARFGERECPIVAWALIRDEAGQSRVVGIYCHGVHLDVAEAQQSFAGYEQAGGVSGHRS